jgi:hypothetical protein
MKNIKKLERKYVSVMKQLRKLPVKKLKNYKAKSSNFRYHIKTEIKRR